MTAGTLTLHVPGGDERSLGPGGSAGGYWTLVFLGLSEASADGTGDVQPRLLDRWEQSADYREWTVHVRENLLWDDGVPVTAEDVKFSLELWTDPEVGYETRIFETITVLDRQSLRITIKQSDLAEDNLFSSCNWLPMLPKHRLEMLDPAEIHSWPFWTRPVGNGPCRHVRHVPKTLTELHANPDFYGNSPKIPVIALTYSGDALIELLSGNVDLMLRLTAT
jgi:peptide/nickel transport system substrate-binding protein